MYFKLLISFGITILISACAATTPVISDKPDAEAELSISILYDNYTVTENTKPDWGFSCLIETADTTLLFDTGKNSEILLHNSKILGINLDAVDQIVISHNHSDHTGGLDAILQQNPDISVYFPTSFPARFNESIVRRNALPVRVDKPIKLAEHVFLTGEMGDQIKEQSLILNTKNGLIILTGCSHQGIVNILQLAKKMFNKDIILVVGGFHLQSYKISKVEEIIEEFKEIGVKQCGASHCTGDTPLALFENAYDKNFIAIGVGRVMRFPY
jgi:7,8-dihydropterin-6-yl-methyl-4-(beta-D-ribofuranosyl)aminobenzene 5'-phosphate synthase